MGVPAEIINSTMCPGCYDEGKTDNPLKNQAGFNATYCTSADGFTKQHVYDDTGTLRLLIKAMTQKIKLAKKREKDAEGPKPPEVKPSENASAEQAASTDDDAPISTNEPKAFSVSEMDSERLAELLGQAVGDSGTLVGAVYALKNAVVDVQDTQTRQAATIEPLNIQVAQRSDGNLALQVFFPWEIGKTLVEKALFNGMGPQFYAQAAFENLASGNFFGGCDVPDFPPIDPRAEGFWLLIVVPEMYVGTTIERTKAFGTTPTAYLQNFIFLQVQNEVFP